MGSNGDGTITLDMLKNFVPSEEEAADEPSLRQDALKSINRVDGGLRHSDQKRKDFVFEDSQDSGIKVHACCTKNEAVNYQVRLLQFVRRLRSHQGKAPSRRIQRRASGDKRVKGSQGAGEDEAAPTPRVSMDLMLKALEVFFQQDADGFRSACSLEELQCVNLGLCEVMRRCLRWSVEVGGVDGLTSHDFLQQAGRGVNNAAGEPALEKRDESGGSRGSLGEFAPTSKAPDASTNAGKKPAGDGVSTARPRSRVPPFFPTKVTWSLSVSTMSECRGALRSVVTLHLGRTDAYWRKTEFDECIDGVEWPPLLENLHFGTSFNQPIANVAFPESLKRMEFSGYFNCSIAHVKWPSALQCLVLGFFFDQPVHQVAWPDSLESIKFTGKFNRSVAEVNWPRSLRSLVFGRHFDRPVHQASWPGRLQQLVFDEDFNHPIDKVLWPRSLQRLVLGDDFDQPVDQVTWPGSLREVVFGVDFNNPISAVSWPGSLQRLTFGKRFNQPLGGVSLPIDLRQLSLGCNFNQRIDDVDWPKSLEQLTFGCAFSQPLVGVVWPDHLKTLCFGDGFGQPVAEVTWPSSLESLSFGVSFHCSLDQVRWPNSLKSLDLGGFHGRPDGVTWPENLKRLTFDHSYGNNEGCGDVTWPHTMDVFYGDKRVSSSTAQRAGTRRPVSAEGSKRTSLQQRAKVCGVCRW